MNPETANNEFFKALRNNGENKATVGTYEAYSAWQEGISAKLDFPFLPDSIWAKDVADFLGTITKAGFTKFAYKSHSTMTFENIVSFMKAGWEITGRIEIPDAFEEYGYAPADCLIFESRDYA